jgi:hypothetical protein
MNRHWKGLTILMLLPLLAFAFALSGQRPGFALLGVIVAIVVGYVLSIAWMRPRRPPSTPDDLHRELPGK